MQNSNGFNGSKRREFIYVLGGNCPIGDRHLGAVGMCGDCPRQQLF